MVHGRLRAGVRLDDDQSEKRYGPRRMKSWMREEGELSLIGFHPRGGSASIRQAASVRHDEHPKG